jgi:3-dehydroquinate synthase
MKTFRIEGSTGSSIILIGEKLNNLAQYIPSDESTIIITDTNVSALYGKDFPPGNVIEIGTGEEIKTIDTITTVHRRLLDLEADRSSFIAAIGGGIVCDVAGFVASTYMRGLRFGFVATTLLSQVDASVGGKNGVNLDGYKNIVGVFKQPEFVICDTELLDTLPEKEIRSGFGEVVKHAALGDKALFEFMEDHYQGCLRLDAEAIQRLLHDSIVLKSALVNEDEREEGVRRRLNLGHTFGHAIEMLTGVTHGEAVSSGMVIAAKLSEKRGLLSQKSLMRLETLLDNMKLPIHIPSEKRQVFEALRRDKKKKGDHIDFVWLTDIGSTVVERISIDSLEKKFDKILFAT